MGVVFVLVLAYLWAVWREVRESAGHVDLTLGIVWALIVAIVQRGWLPLPPEVLMTIQDVATWTLLIFIAVQFFLLAPARLWARRKTEDLLGSQVTFEAGSVKVEAGGSFAVIVAPGQMPIFQPQDVPPNVPSDDDLSDTQTTAGDQPLTGPADPQSPESSKHD